MKIINSTNDKFILRFDRNEEVIDELSKFCVMENIRSGFFTGLGACQKVILSYYDLEKKEYINKVYEEDLEIVTVTGNVAILGEKIAIHSHGSFSNRNYEVFAGHIKNLIVSATCELHLVKLSGVMSRTYDSETGLNLLK